MGKSAIGPWLACLGWLWWGSAIHAAEAPAFDTTPAQGVLSRLLPHQAQQFELGTLPATKGHEHFRIASDKGHIRVEGSTPSALLFGVNWYLKYVAHVQISPNGDRIGDTPFPLPTTTIERETPYAYRYALNENVDGYTAPYWDWPRWQREIDVLALSGINAMLVERGIDSVLYQTFRDVGYSDADIRNWITQPAHQNWQLMGNLCCFNGPISGTLMQKRAASAQRIIARLRELGITPVLPGFYGIVPADFQQKFPRAHVVPQGEWAGFTRPGWLDPRDPMFAKLAAAFYKHQRELFGDSSIYDMEVFQEGGDSGDVPIPEAARDVQNALLAAHPDASWMMLAWQGNPRQDLLAGVNRQHLLIIDIDHDRVPRDNRQKDFQNAPFLFGGIWEFGGRTTLGANTDNITERLQRLGRTNSNMAGTAVFTEGMDTNPFAFDLFTEMAWRSEPVDLATWTANYVQRRYGAADPHALAAWNILLKTAYDIRIDKVVFNSERDAAQESLFDAQPSLTVNRASNWSPEAMRYDPEAFKQVLPALLQVAPALRGSETYQYDLVDISRQTLANESRLLLPQIKTAYDSKDRITFDALTQRWLQLMDLQDELLATNRFFLVGSWLAQIDDWASSPEERTRLDYDVRSLLTTWGNRKASEGASLHDYGNKDWSGLTRDYYRLRWETYFHSLDEALRTGKPAAPIDWFAVGDAWNHGTQRYSDQPAGDAYTVATLVAQILRIPEH
ncbi:alpha-N-acetylglucosaminidase [Dyella caseinilytica]|uniref:Alpha-N-acetylglucosaminidase n=1 Tax=Dyella caseinilytica TaxID=1849581 RepID=A0ABX7GRK9_9GAMM|nr:alpha-N-acetylglucosaminidase [Dyella caseinilytica]QRN53001.1 alpha-N-acetylglucosaminidase [Dyella caseinilytica]GGA10683.1 alpha-N-acetylglucosaminidase [Dyella caseinilytica]